MEQITYLTSQEVAEKAVIEAIHKHKNTHYSRGAYNCDCGESLAYYLISNKTDETLHIFVNCEACNLEYEY
jgi:DNA-directed RNA polymerase subunit M/transcription elongation factor TFIIS